MSLKYDFNDISIIPETTSHIISRNEIDVYDDYGFLPLFVSPMDSVISEKNVGKYIKNKIHVCIPRGEKISPTTKSSNGLIFESYSLHYVKCVFIYGDIIPNMDCLLIDMANGHMSELLTVTKQFKDKFPNIKLMVGNIANPETYKLLSNAGADYIRVGIGIGNACLTSQQLGINYPLASLITECYEISCTLDNPAKIVADGGMKSYSDIIKALSLGSDYVMIGSLFNKSIESSGNNYIFKVIKISQWLAERLFKRNFTIYKSYRGMSTKEVQKKWGNLTLKVSEGINTRRKVEYTLDGWVDNFKAYLKSAMSYTNTLKLSDFHLCKKINITENAYKRFNK
jgi:IMP dehydrogenase/GMP reductase